MTELDAILKAVCENPGEDTPRLCYADAIEDTDPARSEFVRVQVELAREFHADGCRGVVGINRIRATDSGGFLNRCNCPIAELRRRERELLLNMDEVDHTANWVKWRPEVFAGNCICQNTVLSDERYEGIPRVTFTRGFVGSITCSWPDFMRVADALIWTPWQRCLVCKDGFAANYNYPPTAQPISTVRLTAADIHTEGSPDWLRLPSGTGVGYRFTRVTCPTCGGLQPRIISDPHKQCDRCHGTPLNEWHCEKFGRVTFVMPEAEMITIPTTAQEFVDTILNIAHGQTWRYGAHGVT